MLDLAFWLTAAAVLVLLCFSGFFSGSETAMTAASRAKLRANADRGDAGAERALHIKGDEERFIGAILMGNNITNVMATSLATAVLTRLFGVNGVAVASLVMTFLILIFAEVLPKTVAINAPERVSSFVAPMISVLIRVLSPLIALVRLVVRGTLRLFGLRIDPSSRILSAHEEIAGVVQLGHSEGVVAKDERDRILGALDLGERTVEEVMRHRSGIEMIDADADPAAILDQCMASPHTRLPVYKGDPENILGVVHAKDLLRALDKLTRSADATPETLHGFNIADVARPPYFVPETTTLDEQMKNFLRLHTHFALVVDEYGSLRGLITLEDIIEEIVGEITDEFDVSADHPIRKGEDGSYLVDGAMTIRDLNRAADWNLPDDEANTIAGLVIHEAQLIPAAGQIFSFHGFRFEVLARKDNRITRLRMRPL